MPHHVHVIAVPASGDGLRRAIGDAPRRDPRRVHIPEGRRGYLWQGRFASYPREEPPRLRAARYMEQYPVRAGRAASPGEYPGSSARAQVAGRDDALVKAARLLKLVGNWEACLVSSKRAL